jgi:hypothetical protein
MEVAMTRTSRIYQAEIAVDAVLRSKALRAAPGAERNVVSLAASSAQQAANGRNWRWWQDYGGGRHSRPSVLTELSFSDNR